jgi:hypothetical protein
MNDGTCTAARLARPELRRLRGLSPLRRHACALAWLLCCGAGGCAAPPPPAEPARAEPAPLDTIPPRAFAGPPLERDAPLAIAVRMAGEAELRDTTWTSEAEAMGLVAGLTIGVGATGGALAAPLLAVYAVFGATYLPAALSVEGWKQATVREALAEVELPARTLAALRRGWPRAPRPEERAPAPRLDLLIPAYGFVAGEPGEACFFVGGRYTLERPGEPAHEDWLVLEPGRRSADAPPAYCAQLRRFSEHGGALVRRSAEEAAEILAAMLVRRLGPAP